MMHRTPMKWAQPIKQKEAQVPPHSPVVKTEEGLDWG